MAYIAWVLRSALGVYRLGVRRKESLAFIVWTQEGGEARWPTPRIAKSLAPAA